MQYPLFPACSCGLHPKDSEDAGVPSDALVNPLAYLPAPVAFTDEMAIIAGRYWEHAIDWRYYPAFQAAAFLQPKSAQRHSDRKQQFHALKRSADSQGFTIPDSVIELFTTDAYIDRLHHNCIWPSLPTQIIRLTTDGRFALLKFLIEGQSGASWDLLLAPDGTHTVVNSAFCSTHEFRTFQCMDSVNRLLYHYFQASARHDAEYVERLEAYFSEYSA